MAEKNPFVSWIFEIPYGIWLIVVIKMTVVLFVSCVSYYAYHSQFVEKWTRKQKDQALVIEFWLWVIVIVLMAIADVLLILITT